MPEETRYAKCACESCGGHIEFPVEIGGSTVECPHCHFSTPLPAPTKPNAPKRPGMIVSLVMLLLVAAIGYGTWKVHSGSAPIPAQALAASPSTNESQPAPNGSAVTPAVPVASQWSGLQGGPVTLQKVGEGNLVYAVGKLTNVSNQQKFGVKVRVDLFDNNGMKIGSATDYAPSIDAGKAWQFRAMVVDRGAVKAELGEVTED